MEATWFWHGSAVVYIQIYIFVCKLLHQLSCMKCLYIFYDMVRGMKFTLIYQKFLSCVFSISRNSTVLLGTYN